MDRREVVLQGLRRDGLGLEIGGGYSPLVAGQPGLTVRMLDHLDQGGLKAKYAAQGVPTDHIRFVDYVWDGRPYAELVGDQRFDWIVASHVIEHVPDVVGFLEQCADILTPGGVLSLAVPDRRYSFDYYRPESGLGQMVDAHLGGRTLSSPGSVAEHFMNLSRLEGQDVWAEGARGEPEFGVPAEAALGPFLRARAGKYEDVHAWVFTPHSFRLALEDLRTLRLLRLREARFHDTVGCEFFVQLSQAGAGPGLSRKEMALAAVRERAVTLEGSSPVAAPEAVPDIVPAPVRKQGWFRRA